MRTIRRRAWQLFCLLFVSVSLVWGCVLPALASSNTGTGAGDEIEAEDIETESTNDASESAQTDGYKGDNPAADKAVDTNARVYDSLFSDTATINNLAAIVTDRAQPS